MNLSILIPCYNWDTYGFIKQLYELCEKTNNLENFEIIFAEDGSSNCFSNNQIETMQNTRYIVLKENLGRSGIRNFLAEKAKYRWLLFIDCDSKIATKNFIQNYIDILNNKETAKSVYYGDTIYENKKIEKDNILHKKYGENIESKRKKDIFSSHHFLIHKLDFQKIKFDENIKSYGYEDVLFQINSNLMFTHIRNPLYHIGLKETKYFIEDCETGLNNLSRYTNEKIVINRITLLRYWNSFSKLCLDHLIIFIFNIFRKKIIKNLHSSNPSILLFQFYILGFFCKLKKQSPK